MTAYSLAALAGKNRSTSTGRGTFTKRVFSAFQFRDDGLISDGFLSHFDEDFRADGEIDIDARAEFDEAHVFVDVAVFVFSGVGDDSSGDCSGDLSDEDVHSVRCFDDHGGAFVFCAGFGKPGFVEVSFVVHHFFHDAFDGEPVGVDVGDGHKDGNHQSAVVEIFILFDLFNHHNLSVGSSDDGSFCFSAKLSNGTTEEVQHDAIEDGRDGEDAIEGNEVRVLEKIKEDAVEKNQSQGALNENAVPFTV